MSKLTKKQKAHAGKVDANKLYAVADALALVKECATAKFDESIDVAVQLGIDANSVSMPRNLTKWCVAPWSCLTAQVKQNALLCLRKVPRLMKPALPVQT